MLTPRPRQLEEGCRNTVCQTIEQRHDVQQASKRDATHERITCYLSRAPFIPAFLADDEWRAVFCLA
ncbi:hypothetical protein BFX80_00215 [Cobetia marina]|nr:hypothetical protein BFX80_00215 [Cobetia marina]